MNSEINFKNNPLHGLGLKLLLTELVDFYGFDILFAYLNINCFKTNASIDSSVKFLKKTDWAREKVEAFYLYQFKSLPRASAVQFELPPRDRIIPEGQMPAEPAVLSLEDAERLREKRNKKAAEFGRNSVGLSPDRDVKRPRTPSREGRSSYSTKNKKSQEASASTSDPWAKWRDNND